MAIYNCFEDYKEEIELSCVQNHGVELELYSIIASIIREYCPNISLRDVTARRTIQNDDFDLKGIGGFPDFVVLERIMEGAKIFGCIEAKNTYQIYDDHADQINKHIISYRKMLYTNGLEWRFIDLTDKSKNWKVILGTRAGEKFTDRVKNPIIWNSVDTWGDLIEKITKTSWGDTGKRTREKDNGNSVCTVIVKQEDDTYIVTDEGTGTVDQGTTIEEAYSNLRTALELYYD